MEWKKLQLDAKAKGWLVFAMRQSQTEVATQDGPWGNVQGGYCGGLAVYWIAQCYAGKNIPHDPGTKQVADGSLWEATVIQNAMADTPSVSNVSQFYDSGVSKMQMRLSSGNRALRSHGPTSSFLRSVADNAYGCYVVHMENDVTAHAIAIRHGTDGRFHLFDANNGHFVSADWASFKTFLIWFLRESGYAERYKLYTWVCGVKPPM